MAAYTTSDLTTGRGRITLYHVWESGMDNSPRWDGAYANVVPGVVPEYQRKDNAIVVDPSQRPTDAEYDRYLWLLEEMKTARYDDELLPKVMSFAVEDVFVLRGGELVRKEVRWGVEGEETLEVVSGLRAGDQIVVNNMSDYSGVDRLRLD